MKSVILLWGLPGSGKTTWAESQRGLRIDVDEIAKTADDVYAATADAVAGTRRREVIIDGLFTTNERAERLFEAVLARVPDARFTVVFWGKNVEACKLNDRARGRGNADLTIEHLPFEEPSKGLLEKYDVSLLSLAVECRPVHEVWALENGVDAKSGKLASERWCLGGTWCYCGGEVRNVTPEPQPTNFAAFDDFLGRVCPQITLLQYKRAYSGSVTVEATHENDYYGGGCDYAQYVCDLGKLYAILREMGLVSE